MVDPARIRLANDAPIRPDRAYVLYWMTGARRTRFNPALERAVQLAESLGRPLLVFEGLRLDYPHASVRHHSFAREGMLDNLRSCAEQGVTYIPWIELSPGDGHAAFAAVVAQAVVVVADDMPGGFGAGMVRRAARTVDVRMEAVDGWGLYPFRATDRAFSRAVDFRRHLQRSLGAHLDQWPQMDPLALYDCGAAVSPVPRQMPAEWPVDASVPKVPLRGGELAGRMQLASFAPNLPLYAEARSHPDAQVDSGLSPWLHWGHLSVFEVMEVVAPRARPVPNGAKREGGWGGIEAESFLDELVTWRELCANTACHLPDSERWESLPGWARASLEAHAEDPREVLSLEALEEARTPDPLWNAAQRQLRTEGRIHNYLRMLWGKNVIAWSASPREAWERLIHLNNKWSVDGRDPNSWGGVGWVFGRYDRPWGPERPIFGVVRYMTSGSTVRKLALREYLARWSA